MSTSQLPQKGSGKSARSPRQRFCFLPDQPEGKVWWRLFGGLQFILWKLSLLHPCFAVAFLISGFRFTLPSTCVVFAFDMCCHELLEICSVCSPISRPEKRQLKWEDWLKPPCWAAGLLFALVLGFLFVLELVACLVFSVSCQSCSGRLCSYKAT